MRALFRELKAWERVFLFSALLLFPLLSFLDSSLLHPGYCEIDEVSPLRHAWVWLHGESLMPAVFTGTLHRAAVAACIARLPHCTAWALQLARPACLCLRMPPPGPPEPAPFQRARGGRRHSSSTSSAPTAWLRSRAVLCYALLPCELLLVLEFAADSAALSWRGWLAGALAGIFFLEYEAWPAAFLALAFCAFALRQRLRIRLSALAWGLGLGLALTAWLARQSLIAYFIFRKALTLGAGGGGHLAWGSNLLHLFSGGQVLPSMGVENYPALAPWAWPFIALGVFAAWKRGKWVLAWAALGLLPMLAPSAGFTEANRGIAAWPALGLLAGLGFTALPEKAWLRWVLAAWLALGAVVEAKAFFRSQDQLAPENYALSQAQRSTGKWLAQENAKAPIRFLSQLGYERGSEIEWAAQLPAQAGGSAPQRVIAWIPWEAVPALGPDAARLQSFSDPQERRHVFLLEPSPQLLTRLEKINAELGPRIASLNSYDVPGRARTVRAWLDQEPGLDPWVRTVLWQRWMTDAASLGIVTGADVDALLKRKAGSRWAPQLPGLLLGQKQAPTWLRACIREGLGLGSAPQELALFSVIFLRPRHIDRGFEPGL